jgi:hypothetical protein
LAPDAAGVLHGCSPLAGYKKTFRRAVDGRTRKWRESGFFRRPFIYEPDSENAGNGRSEARA